MANKDLKRVSFFIPFRNEEQGLYGTVQTVLRIASACLDDFEILLINDNSTDRSIDSIESLLSAHSSLRLLHLVNKSGFGAGYLCGLQNSLLPNVMYLSGDGDVNEAELTLLLKNWDGKSLLVQHCQNLSCRPSLRYVLSKSFTALVQIFSGTDLPYYNGYNILPKGNLDLRQLYDFGFCTQAWTLLSALKKNPSVQVQGTDCLFHDETSQALTKRNFFSAFRFFISMLGSPS